MHRRIFVGIGGVLLAAFALPFPVEAGRAPQGDEGLLALNSKLSATFTISKFDKKLGGTNVLIDPYFGKRQPTPTSEISYRQLLTYEDSVKEGGKEKVFNLSSEINARFNQKYELTNFVFEYRFSGELYKAAYEPEKQAGKILIEKKGQVNTVDLNPSSKDVIIGFTPELGFLQLIQTKRLNLEHRHKILLVLPADRDMVLQEVTFRNLGAEVRRYADRLINVFHLVVEEPPEFFSLRHFYVDGYGRILETTTMDDTRIFLSSETQFTRCEKELDTWYKNIYVIPQNQEERHIGWFHSTLVPNANGLTYTAERTLKRPILEVVRDFRETWNISITPTYQIETLVYTRSFATTEVKAEYNAQTRKITYSMNDSKDKVVEVPPERNFYGTVDLAVFVLAQREELLKANIHSATLLDPENRDILTVSIALKNAVLRDYLDGRVYTLQTTVAVEDEVRAEVYLDKYGRAMEVSMKEKFEEKGKEGTRDGLRTIVTKSSLTAKGGAREPTPPSVFSNPFAKKTKPEAYPEHLRKLENLEKGYGALSKKFTKLKEAVATKEDPLIKELYPQVKDLSERFVVLLNDYRKQLEADREKEIEEDSRVPLWEEQVKKWRDEADSYLNPGETVETEFRAELDRIVGLIKERKVEEAKNRVPVIEKIIDDPRASPPQRQKMLRLWEPIKSTLVDLEIEIKLERVNFDIPAIAWELDHVERPVHIRFDLFGSGLDMIERVKIVRIRAYAVLGTKMVREGDVIESEGLKLTVYKIEKDKVTLKVGRFVKEFLIRQ